MMLTKLNMTANENGRRQDTETNDRYWIGKYGTRIGTRYRSDTASNLHNAHTKRQSLLRLLVEWRVLGTQP